MNGHAPRLAVLGAGHGGQAMAADLALRGCAVTLWGRSPEKIAPVVEAGGITLEERGFAALPAVSSLSHALTGADLIMVVVPATGHQAVARCCAPYLKDGQVIVLNPGRTGGALEFLHTLRRQGCYADVTVAEAQTFLFASRITGPAQARIFGTKRRVEVAALPAWRTGAAVELLNRVYPQFKPARSVLHTSLDNMGAIFHPALTLLNTGRIEGLGGAFDYYHEGVTPAVARVLEAIDSERCRVAEMYGVQPTSAREWLFQAYGAGGETLREAVLANAGYAGIKAPQNLQHRYLSEDVPTSLVPLAALGELAGVPTPTILSIVQLASMVHGVDYAREGRTLERLGLAGLTVEQVQELALTGLLTEPQPDPMPDLVAVTIDPGDEEVTLCAGD